MGWRPHDVYACTIPEFWAAFDGWQRAQGIGDAPAPMDMDEFARLVAKHGLTRADYADRTRKAAA